MSSDDRVIADAGAYADFLLARPEVTGSAIGTTGYCLGGRMSMIAAGGHGHKIAAAASFHGGGLAVADDPRLPGTGPHSTSCTGPRCRGDRRAGTAPRPHDAPAA